MIYPIGIYHSKLKRYGKETLWKAMIRQIAKKKKRKAFGKVFNLNTMSPNKKRTPALKIEDGKAVQKKLISINRSELNKTYTKIEIKQRYDRLIFFVKIGATAAIKRYEPKIEKLSEIKKQIFSLLSPKRKREKFLKTRTVRKIEV